MKSSSEAELTISFTSRDDLSEPVFDSISATTLLEPIKDQYVILTITAKNDKGEPMVGIPVNVSSQPTTLLGNEWRSRDGLCSRWPSKSAQILRDRIDQGVVRLSAYLDKKNGVTNDKGQFSIRVYAWHVCGEENEPASDKITFSWLDKTATALVSSGMKLVRLENEIGWKVHLSPNARGRYVQSNIIPRLIKIGNAWDDIENGPDSTGFNLLITDASTRWGGLFPPHLSHRFGGTVDFRVPSKDGESATPKTENYDKAGVEWLCSLLKWQGASEIRFSDNVPGVTNIDQSHENHLHVSFLNHPAEPWSLNPATDGQILFRSSIMKIKSSP